MERVIKLIKDKKLPLNLKLALAVIIGLAISACVFIFADNLTTYLIDNVYMSDSAVDERSLDKIEDFSRFVSKNKLNSDDMDAIMKWQNEEKDVYILIYNNNNLIYNSTWWDDDDIMENMYQSKTVINHNTDEGNSDDADADQQYDTDDFSQLEDSQNFLWQIKNSIAVANNSVSDSIDAETDTAASDISKQQEAVTSDEEESDIVQVDETDDAESDGDVVSSDLMLLDDASDEYKFYPVKFQDGVFEVCVIDYGEYNLYTVAYVSSFILSCVVFLIFILLYNSRLIHRVTRLSTEIVNIENNDINAPITQNGRDELQVLSENIDHMRNTIIEQLSNEREAWQANRDLVTSMAHDIRTPLTVLNGYLDLLNEKEYDSEETMDEYLNICSEKAVQLKDLSDKLFRYFFVYSGKKDDLNFEIYDADDLFQQMLGEYIILLREKGYIFNVDRLKEKANIKVDSIYLKRLFDNIFTNIRKYADMNQPVNVCTSQESGHILLKLENVISPDRNEAESTKMGIKTCEKIAQEMEMKFSTEEKNGRYIVSVVFNVEK
jgi:signal transduction histidine kinase